MAATPFGLGLACFALVVAAASATQFRVGGQKGWSVPDAGFEPYNTWAARLRFQKGDQLLFVYPKETDSVLLVDKTAYDACNASSYVQKFDDGNTVFTLDRSGPFFFISGNEANCRANEKLNVVVLADRSGTRTPPAPGAPPTMSPPPSPAPMPPSPSSSPPAAAPAMSPSSPPTPSGTAPMPAPAATPTSPPSPAATAPGPAPSTTPGSPPAPMAPSPSTTPGGGASQPPSGSANAPGAASTTPPPPSAAAPVVAGFVGSLGAFICYAMLAA